MAGGVACALNGFVRATEDLDILIEASASNILKLLKTLESWGEGYARELRVEDFPLEPGAVRIIEDFPLDIFTLISGKPYADFLPNVLKTRQGIQYLDLKSLIETKKNNHREKDDIDILALRRIAKDSVKKKSKRS